MMRAETRDSWYCELNPIGIGRNRNVSVPLAQSPLKCKSRSITSSILDCARLRSKYKMGQRDTNPCQLEANRRDSFRRAGGWFQRATNKWKFDSRVLDRAIKWSGSLDVTSNGDIPCNGNSALVGRTETEARRMHDRGPR